MFGNKKNIDKVVLLDFCKGSKEAYEHIYRQFFNEIYAFVLKYIICKDLAYDLTQDIFLKIWEKREQLADVENFRSYLYRMTKNYTLDKLKHISISRKAIEHITYQYSKECEQSDTKYLEKEYFEFLEAAITDLPKQTRTVFMLCREEEKSYKEVAEELGISRDAVKHHMIQSVKVLKNKAEKRFPFLNTKSSY